MTCTCHPHHIEIGGYDPGCLVHGVDPRVPVTPDPKEPAMGTSESDLDRWRRLLEAVPLEEPWPKREIDRDGTCDGCAEDRHLVAAYDDPVEKNEPWFCAECAAEADLIAEAPTALRALLATVAGLDSLAAMARRAVEQTGTTCRCADEPHQNLLHDLAHDLAALTARGVTTQEADDDE